MHSTPRVPHIFLGVCYFPGDSGVGPLNALAFAQPGTESSYYSTAMETQEFTELHMQERMSLRGVVLTCMRCRPIGRDCQQ